MGTYGAAAKAHWPLEPDMIFLNHGSYGATPKRVLAEQQRLRDRLEAQPCQFINLFAPGALRKAAADLAGFLSARPDDLVFVENTTGGINAVLGSIDWQAGDEMVVVDHIYNAVRNTGLHLLPPRGASLKVVELGLPVLSPDDITSRIEAALGPKTRLVLVDHVASVSGVVFPVADIAALCSKKQIPVLVDGAHAPGMLDLDVPGLGVDWYVGNCHKWLCAPKGAAFLWARKDRQDGLHPRVISHDLGKGFTAEFDKVGTRDQTAWLSVPEALRFHAEMGGADLRRRNHEVVTEAAQKLADRFGTETGAPAEMFGSMATIRLPDRLPATRPAADALKTHLWTAHRAEAHVMPFANALWLRISVQAYNDLDECLALGPMIEAAFRPVSARLRSAASEDRRGRQPRWRRQDGWTSRRDRAGAR